MGMARREKAVSCFLPFQPSSFGPKPMENSITSIPVSRAAMKCPHSCTIIRMPNSKMANRTYNTVILLLSCGAAGRPPLAARPDPPRKFLPGLWRATPAGSPARLPPVARWRQRESPRRKAATAASLAPLSTAQAAPPARRHSPARRRAGKRSGSPFSKVRVPRANRSNAAPPVGRRSG